MEKNGAIILIEEDQDDVQIFSDIFEDLHVNHDVICFSTIEEAFVHLKTSNEKPFIILCDNNWRNKNQLRLKHEMENYAEGRLKSIPFIFYASTIQNDQVNSAFNDLNVQGFFQKGTEYNTIKSDLSLILNYWERSLSPVI